MVLVSFLCTSNVILLHCLQVRGAPAIAIVGSLSLALQLKNSEFEDKDALQKFVNSSFQYLLTARPTAVNIAKSANRFSRLIMEASPCVSVQGIKDHILAEIEGMLEEDVRTNRNIGNFGAEDIMKWLNGKKATVLTHCNTGSLATAGYGTALGIIRSLHSMDALSHVYCTETRPYNQGARLTAYELVYENIPATLICDSMGSLLMKEKGINVVVVGADRVVSNGDTANKIGTFQLAIAAQYHRVPFYVAAPVTTLDFSLVSGDQIKIEERPSKEMFYVGGNRVAAEGIGCWNPAFDVTPASLITGGIVTERGVFAAGNLKSLLL